VRPHATDAWPSGAEYAWAEHWESTGVCVAMVRGRSPEEVLREMILDPPIGIVPVDAAREWAGTQPMDRYGTTFEIGEVEGGR
jgi:hypothetical protein